ncbi:sugar transport protein 14-like [Gossypium australe]|uniref:Sugar transport protein 14-like n=1 Tax=Gossypium australe TaxID=47621 RepID=A0A5B6UKT6_9ROSI|nr:sugar transport protein 14-like [Gossypium australe]
MAGGGFTDDGNSKRAHLYEYNITSYFIFACLVAAMGGSLFGYDLGVSGGVTSMDDFLKEFFPKIYRRKQESLTETDYCKYDNQLLTLFTSSLYFAGLISTFGASYVTRIYGRKGSILVGGISFFFGGVINAASVNILMLIIGRILLGAGIGSTIIPIRNLTSKTPRSNKPTLPINHLSRHPNIANAINYATEQLHPWGWRLSLGLATFPATLMFLGGLILPETPNSLVEQGKLEEAKKVLIKVRGTPNIDAEFADLVEASDAARAIKHPFRNLLLKKNRPQLVIGALGIPAFQQLTGMNSILFYAPTLGFGSSAALFSSLITSGALVIAASISMGLVDKFGRRAFFLEAGTEMFICMIAVAITLALEFGEGEPLPVGVGWFLVCVLFLFVLAYGRSWGPLGWLVPSEIFPLETRSAGQSMVVCMNLLFTALIAQCFLVSLCHLKYGIFFLFAGLIFIMTAFIYFLLPETKQVPIEEVYLLWKDHWFWKRYVDDHDRYGSDRP